LEVGTMASVRVFGYAGIVQLEQRMLKFHNSDSVFMRQEPYIWSQVLVLNATAGPAVETTVNAAADDQNTTMIVVEVDDNTSVRYELNPNGLNPVNHRVAGNASPKLRGENVFQWFAGATMSFVNVT
jgi:hypothetical protein